MRLAIMFAALAAGAFGCSEEFTAGLDQGARPSDGAAAVDGPAADTGPARDADGAVAEKEPNDGKTSTDFQTVSVPVRIRGAIGKANDRDVFGFNAPAGFRFVARVKSDGTMQPHLAVFTSASLRTPAAVSLGAPHEAMAEHYALRTRQYFVAVSDKRNVPASSSANVGGPAYTYTLTIEPLTRSPIPIRIGATSKTTMNPAGVVRVFSFDAAAGSTVDVSVYARRLAPPSDVDPRLSLFYVKDKNWISTIDNVTGMNGDARLGGKLAWTGTYHAIVENVAPTTGSNLAIEVRTARN